MPAAYITENMKKIDHCQGAREDPIRKEKEINDYHMQKLRFKITVAGEESSSQNYPVILFIHGESFEWNSGNLYDGSVIASFGKVIFITINFRLGIFGFLKEGIKTTPGRTNFGLSDQIAALQWIKGNIAEFKGDPSNVTVMGFGTGAACVNFLMLSPVAEGLFHRAILMGGTALSEWVLTAVPLHYIHLGEELKCSTENMINCLQRKRKDDIISAFKSSQALPFENTFTPVVDEVIVLQSPAQQMNHTLFSKYDLLAGVSEIESYYLLEDDFLKRGLLLDEASKLIETYTKLIYKKTPDIAFEKTVEKYLGHLADKTPIPVRNSVLDALSDMLVTAPLLQTARYHGRTPKQTFLYVFGHHTTSENHIKVKRTISGDDLPYALGVPIDGPFNHYQSDYNADEERLSETMMRYFTNFAKTGNPNMPTSYDFLTFSSHFEFKNHAVRWPRFTLDRQPYMYLGLTPQIRYHYREEYDKFWNHALPNAIKNMNDGLKNIDAVENDDVNYPINDPDFTSSPDRQTTHKIPFSSSEAVSANQNVETASITATVLIILGVLFLLVNVTTIGIIFYQRGKSKVRDNLFRNRFRCKAISVPDIFEENANGDIYAIAESRQKEESEMKKPKSKKNTSTSNCDDKYDAIRVASVNPEAISGKRLKRWPLSRQCSGSTIVMDSHSKVRDWIANEIVSKCSPRFLRRKKKRTPNEVDSTVAKATTSKRGSQDKRKVSIAIDATPAARTGSVLKQIPIEVTKSLDDGKNPLTSQMRPSTSMMCIPKKPSFLRSYAFSSEDSDEYYNRTGTHKSSAHIRLRTPEFLLDVLPAVAHHAHSKSDASPELQVEVDSRELLYTPVNKQAKRLKSFVDSSKNTSINDSVESTSHYEDINILSLHEDLNSSCYLAHDQLSNIKRRNYPKVLPDFPDNERKNSKRLSLPSINFDPKGADFSKHRSRIPPAPPPRLSSTLGRKSSLDSDKQFSHITVQLKKPEPVILEEKSADIIQTESSQVPSSDYPSDQNEKPSQIPRYKSDSTKPAKDVRSVTTSTTGIPKLVPYSKSKNGKTQDEKV
ncbi:neuroligin-4, X-linked-like isoform X2 [Planococcus citri]|uniref:neuroligin-4, X-linked-like isoform X2 n=1 Tax=Planococcus citri TaxID=170843 RepID=UPI0031F9D219